MLMQYGQQTSDGRFDRQERSAVLASGPGLVVVGAGQAGFQLAASVRAGGYEEPITIVGRETYAPYQRPPLSKAYLLGKQSRDALLLQKPAFYEASRINLLTGRNVARIDRTAGCIELSDGASLPFDRLAIATGARNRVLPLPGAEFDGILGLRDLSDADDLQARLEGAERVVVVGGGFIGLEFAAVARQLGKRVLVVEALERLMSRAVPAPVSRFFRDLHESRGVHFEMAATVHRFLNDGRKVTGIELADGSVRPADLVLVGVGVVPNQELAADAGLAVGNGIKVDGRLVSSDPRIAAIGDCAAFPGSGGQLRRIESVQNAVDHAKHAARSMLGVPDAYCVTPWFWSDQYEFKLQIVGITADADQVVLRGSMESGKFSAFSFRQGALIGVDAINQPVDHALARKLLSTTCSLSPEEAGDSDFDLRRLTRAQA